MTFFKGQKWHRPKREKHVRAKGRVQTTPAQRQALLAIRRRLALKGYQIFPVAKWFRRNPNDFVAVPRMNANMLLVVRPLSGRRNELLVYGFPSSYNHLRTYLESSADCGMMVWGEQLPAENLANDWRLFIPRTNRRELRLFTDAG